MAPLPPLRPGLGPPVTGRRPHTAPVTFTHSFMRGERGGCRQMWTHTHSGRPLSLQLDSLIQNSLDSIRSAFTALDPDRSGKVTKDEFRQVLASLLVLYQNQNQNQINALINEVCERSSESVDYLEFLSSFSRVVPTCRPSSSRHAERCVLQSSGRSLREIQTILKEKVGGNLGNPGNLRNLERRFHRGENIQKNELRQILERCRVQLSDEEFQRLWLHCSPRNTSSISYPRFLEKLGCGDSQDSRIAPVCTKIEVCGCGKTPPEHRPSILPPGKLQTLFHDTMCSSSSSVWRTLQAFDTAHSGVVKQEVLRAVLNSFIFPMSLHSFQKLTSRYGVKPAEQVRWKHFLNLFMNSDKEADTVLNTSRICKGSDKDEDKLNFQDIFPQLREIFQLLDKTKAGRITRAELRSLLERPNRILQPRLQCSHIKDLLNLLDPEHTGLILFCNLERLKPEILETKPSDLIPTQPTQGPEETEDPAREQKPECWTSQAADGECAAERGKEEDLLQDKLREQPGAALEDLKLFDPQRSGNVTRKDLRRLLSCCGISDTHFNKAPNIPSCRPCTPPQTTQQSARRRHPTPASLQASPDTRNIQELVFQRMRSKLEERHCSLAEQIQAVTHRCDGQLSERDVQKILEDSSVRLDDADFSKFLVLLGFSDGRIESAAFLHKFAEATGRQQRSKISPLLKTAEQCLAAMKARIQSVHGNMMAAFLVMDRRRRGVVDLHDFRDLYDSLGFLCRTEEYEQLLERLGLHPGGNLNYAEFVDVVEKKGKAKPGSRSERVQQQLHDLLSSEARCKWADMSKALCSCDSDGRGWIHKSSLRRFLFTYALPLTTEEFEKLWCRYDAASLGRVQVCDFLEKLGFHHKREFRSLTSKTQGAVSSEAEPLQRFQKVLEENYEAFRDRLVDLDWSRDGTVTLEELLSVVNTKTCCIQRDQLLKHLHSLNVSMDKNRQRLRYMDFLAAFNLKPGKSEHLPVSHDALQHTESLVDLSLDAALVKLQELVTASASDLFKAFSAFDQTGTGLLKALDFRRVLENFCARLSDKQFRFTLSKLELDCGSCSVNWKDFLHKFMAKSKPVSAERCFSGTKPSSPPKSRTSGISNQLRQIQEVTSGHLKKTPKERTDQDPSDDASVSTELCDGLADDQPERVWMQELQHGDFLNGSGARIRTSHSDGGDSNSKLRSACSERRGSISPAAVLHRAQASFLHRTAGTGSPAGGVERQLYVAVRSRWQEIQRSSREEDPQQDGLLSPSCFLKILRSLGVDVTLEQLEHLAVKSDIMSNGRVSYQDFLKHFLLNLRPAETQRRFERRKLPLPAAQVSHGAPSRSCVDAMLRIYDVIGSSWTAIRRRFLSADIARTGSVSVQDFRKVLLQFSVKLSSDEFFHLCSYFDGDSRGRICYNRFLWAFLR